MSIGALMWLRRLVGDAQDLKGPSNRAWSALGIYGLQLRSGARWRCPGRASSSPLDDALELGKFHAMPDCRRPMAKEILARLMPRPDCQRNRTRTSHLPVIHVGIRDGARIPAGLAGTASVAKSAIVGLLPIADAMKSAYERLAVGERACVFRAAVAARLPISPRQDHVVRILSEQRERLLNLRLSCVLRYETPYAARACY